MHAYVGVVSHPYFAVSGERRQVRAADDSAGHLHDRSGAREARPPDADRDARREGRERNHVHVQTGRMNGPGGWKLEAGGWVQQASCGVPASNLRPPTSWNLNALASPLRQARHRLHGPADRGGRHGDEHRLGPLGARLADDVRVEHVHVPAEQVGRRHPLRAQPPADREHGRVPDDHPGGVDLVGRAAPLGPAPRLRGARRGDPAGPARRNHRALLPAAGDLDRPRRARADLLLPHADAGAGHVAAAGRTPPRRSTTRCCGASRATTTLSSTRRSSSARRCGTPTRGWRFPISRSRSAT